MIEEIVLVFAINILGMMSPGPDFILVLRSAIIRSQRYAQLVAVGIAIGLICHVGIALLAVESVKMLSDSFFLSLQIAGSAYLIYLASKLLFPSRNERERMLSSLQESLDASGNENHREIDSAMHASLSRQQRSMGKSKESQPFSFSLTPIVEGFVCNLLNMKAFFFFLSLFSQIVPVHGLSEPVKWLYGLGIPMLGLVWFSFLSWLLFLPIFRQYIVRYQLLLSRCMGVLLVGFAFFTVYSGFLS